MNKNNISAVIITKNEEKNIVEVVKNVSFADEVLVIDNSSEDQTVELAKKSGAIVYVEKFSDYAQQRNYALDKAKGNWILYVDADERVTPELKKEILKVTNEFNPIKTHYIIERKNFYFGKHEWPYIEQIERLFVRDKLVEWYGKIHESPRTVGDKGKLTGYLKHYTHKNLSTMIKKTVTWSSVEAELLFKSNHPQMSWWRFLRIMLTKFSDSYFAQGGWKVGAIGFIESMYQAFSYFVVYAKLWEKQLKTKSERKN